MAAHIPVSSLPSEVAPSSGVLRPQNTILLESRRQNELPVSLQEANTVLHVTIHHAKDLHNICIYGNQDVYARFSLTNCEDAVYSTQPVKAGGRNPVFNQSLKIPAPRPDVVLKCEIWMMSCARNYLEDQLLGFVLVPLASLLGKGKRSQDFVLTSTDLFFTPAGTVCLSLLFHRSSRDLLELGVNGRMLHDSTSSVCPSPSSSPVVTMDDGYQSLGQPDLSKIEFPDLVVASENQRLISAYLKWSSFEIRESNNGEGHLEDGMTPVKQGVTGTTILELSGSPTEEEDCEMSLTSEEENCMEMSQISRLSPHPSYTSPSSNGSLSISSKNTVVSSATDQHCEAGQALNSNSPSCLVPPDIQLLQPATSSSTIECYTPLTDMNGNQGKGKAILTSNKSEGSVLNAPLGNISIDKDVPVVQQEIVDIYIKSMQQFTEKLAEMKLPFNVEAQNSVVSGETKIEKKDVEEGRKVGNKLFYGSRELYGPFPCMQFNRAHILKASTRMMLSVSWIALMTRR